MQTARAYEDPADMYMVIDEEPADLYEVVEEPVGGVIVAQPPWEDPADAYEVIGEVEPVPATEQHRGIPDMSDAGLVEGQGDTTVRELALKGAGNFTKDIIDRGVPVTPGAVAGILGGEVYRGLARGSAGLGQAAGELATFSWNRMPDGTPGKQTALELGQGVSDYYKGQQEAYAPAPETQKNVLDHPETFFDPRYWAGGVGEMAPSLAASMLPYSAVYQSAANVLKNTPFLFVGGKQIPVTPEVIDRVSQLVGSISGGAAGGLLEGLGTYGDLREKEGWTEPQAALAGTVQGVSTIGTNAVGIDALTRKIIGKTLFEQGLRRGLVGVTEAATETAEGGTEVYAKDLAKFLSGEATFPEDWAQRMAEGMKEEANVAGPAFLTGAIMAGGGGVHRPTQAETKPAQEPQVATTDPLAQAYEQTIFDLKANGLDDLAAKIENGPADGSGPGPAGGAPDLSHLTPEERATFDFYAKTNGLGSMSALNVPDSPEAQAAPPAGPTFEFVEHLRGHHLEKLDPTLATNLDALAREFYEQTGRKLRISDGFRTFEQQADVYRRKPNLAAKPGTSRHEVGQAVDIHPEDAAYLISSGLGQKHGMDYLKGRTKTETWHWQMANTYGTPYPSRQQGQEQDSPSAAGLDTGRPVDLLNPQSATASAFSDALTAPRVSEDVGSLMAANPDALSSGPSLSSPSALLRQDLLAQEMTSQMPQDLGQELPDISSVSRTPEPTSPALAAMRSFYAPQEAVSQAEALAATNRPRIDPQTLLARPEASMAPGMSATAQGMNLAQRDLARIQPVVQAQTLAARPQLPAGGIAPEQMPKPVMPEPKRNIEAQLAAIQNPRSQKKALLVTPGSPLPASLPPGTTAFLTQHGTVITTDPTLKNKVPFDATDQEIGRHVLGWSKGSPAMPVNEGAVVRALDEAGNPVSEIHAAPNDVRQAVKIMREHSPIGRVTLARVGDVLAERMASAQADRWAPEQKAEWKGETDDRIVSQVMGRVHPGKVTAEQRKTLASIYGPSIFSKTTRDANGSDVNPGNGLDQLAMEENIAQLLPETYGSDGLYAYLVENGRGKTAAAGEWDAQIDAEAARMAEEGAAMAPAGVGFKLQGEAQAAPAGPASDMASRLSLARKELADRESDVQKLHESGNPYAEKTTGELFELRDTFAKRIKGIKDYYKENPGEMAGGDAEILEDSRARRQKVSDALQARVTLGDAQRRVSALDEGVRTGKLTLTEEEVSKALADVKDSYVEKGVAGYRGETFGEQVPDAMLTSDLSGRKIRYYTTLPDGRIAHPDEIHEARRRGNIIIEDKGGKPSAPTGPAPVTADAMVAEGGYELDDVPFSLADHDKPGTTKTAVEKATGAVQRNAAGAAETIIVQTQDELPDAVKNHKDAKGKRIEGAVHDGKVYLVADNLSSAARAVEVWLHEQVGHVGMRGLFASDKAFNTFLDGVAETLGLESRQQAEESVARIAEKLGAGNKVTADERSVWRKLVDYVRSWLLKSGFKMPVKTSDIDNMLRSALANVKRGGRSKGPRIATNFSAKNNPNTFIEAPGGGIDYGQITQKMADRWGGKAAPIRLLNGDGVSGAVHIEKNHGRQIKDGDVKKFVHSIAQNFDAIFKGDGKNLILAIRGGKPWKAAVVKLEYVKDGDFYSVKTASPIRPDYFVAKDGEEKKKLLWEGAQSNHLRREAPGAVSGQRSSSEEEITQGDKDSKGGPKPLFHRTDKLGFYSQMGEVLEKPGMLPKVAKTGAEMAAVIGKHQKSGKFKGEELADSGIMEWLASQDGPVTREDVLDEIQARRVEVKEVVKGGDPALDRIGVVGNWLEKQDHGYPSAKVVYAHPDLPGAEIAQRQDGSWSLIFEGRWVGDAESMEEAAHQFSDREQVSGEYEYQDETKFSQYQIPGGKNYKELVFTLPKGDEQIIREMKAKYGEDFNTDDLSREDYQRLVDADKADYKSSHWDEPNPVAHARISERTDADGKRVLHVEEIQSDWHQEGRKKGYKTPVAQAPVFGANGFSVRESADHPGFWDVISPDGRVDDTATSRAFAERIAAAGGGRNMRDARDQPASTPGVPDAPFKKSWPMLVMKRIMRYAAENGFDRVAWTPGEVQAERYDLSNQVDSIKFWKPIDEHGITLLSIQKAGVSIEDSRIGESIPSAPGVYKVKDNNLPNIVGKELADKIIQNRQRKPATYSGLDLKVGGEGMRGFYDKILPSEVNKYIGKWGGKVSEMRLSGSEKVADSVRNKWPLHAETAEGKRPIFHFDITPAMREAILGGQPLYQKTKSSTTGSTVASIEKAIQPLLVKLKGIADRVQVVQSYGDLPVGLYAAAKHANMIGGFDAVYWQGDIYIVADAMTAKEAQARYLKFILGHEGGHHVARTMFPDRAQRQEFFTAIAKLAPDQVAAYLDKHGLKDTEANRIMAAEEVAMDMVGDSLASMKGALKFRMKQFLARLRKLLAQIMPERFKEASDQMILDFVAEARAAIRRDGDVVYGVAGGAFHRKDGGERLAPNGKPSKLNAAQYEQVRTKEFKDWFGDWESLARQNEEQKRGEAAMNTILSNKSGDVVAMNRPGLGDVIFLYGKPGRLNQKGRLVEGEGVSHLVEQRNLEGRDGEAVARKMPEVIAHGRVVAIQGEGTAGERVRVEHEGHTAVLSLYRGGARNTWLLTGWENEGGGAGVNPATAYASASSGISQPKGASDKIISLNAHIVNSSDVSAVLDENGEPMVVYHGTGADFNAFGHGSQKPNSYFFTEEKALAKTYGARVVEAYVSVKNPASSEDVYQSARDVGVDEDALEDEYPGVVLNMDPGIVENLVAKGFDGWVGMDSSAEVTDMDEAMTYVVFSPNQIKSATGNNGQFSKDNDDIRFHRRQSEPDTVASQGLPPETWFEMIQRVVQDKMNRLAKAVKIIEARTGQALLDHVNAALRETLYSGRTTAAIEDFEKIHVKPLIQAIKDADLTLADVESALYAFHAKRRNMVIAERTKGENLAGSGITNERANEILASLRNDGKMDRLMPVIRRVWNINKARLALLESSGLESAETIQMWKDAYGENYVPLKTGVAAKGNLLKALFGDEGKKPRTGKGYDIRGRESRYATGRHSEAGNILANIMAQYEEAVIRAEKNRVGQSFLRMVEENPDKTLWEVDKTPLKPFFNTKTGEVEIKRDPRYKLADNVLSVKVDGREHLITIHDPLLARAMKNMGVEQTGKFMRAMASYNRFLSLINTSLDPEFVISNFLRDIQTAGLNLTAEDKTKLAKQVAKDALSGKTMKGIFLALREKDSAKDNDWSQWYERFRKAGGKIGFFGLNTVEQQGKRLENMLKESEGDGLAVIRKNGREILDFISDVNSSVENAMRLSVFRRAVESGVSVEKAAAMAKELTVNFNKKGEAGSTLNALYLFANASIQGNARILKALMTSKRGAKLTASIAGAAFLLAMFNRVAGGDDDDGQAFWDKIDDSIKARNLVIMKWWKDDGGYLSVPMPYGYNVIKNVGDHLERLAFGNHKPLAAASGILLSFIDAFNPMGQSGTVIGTLLPTVTRPFVEIATNKDFGGNPIRPEQAPWDKKPQSQLAWSTVAKPAKAMAEELNKATGGNEFEPGKVDVSPEDLEHLWSAYTGGVGRFLGRMANLGMNAFQGTTPATKDIPFARRLMGEQSPYVTPKQFYEAVDVLKRKEDAYEAYRKENPARAKDYWQDNADMLALLPKVKAAEKELKGLYKERDAIKARGIPAGDKSRQTEAVDARVASVQKAFLREYLDDAPASKKDRARAQGGFVIVQVDDERARLLSEFKDALKAGDTEKRKAVKAEIDVFNAGLADQNLPAKRITGRNLLEARKALRRRPSRDERRRERWLEGFEEEDTEE